MKNKINLIWLRFLAVQIVGGFLLLSLLTKEIFRSPLIVQITFAIVTISTGLINIYLLREIKKVASEKTIGAPSVKIQLRFSLLTLLVSIFGFYRMMTAVEDFQKMIGLICGILFFIMSLLCLWGVKYVTRTDRN